MLRTPLFIGVIIGFIFTASGMASANDLIIRSEKMGTKVHLRSSPPSPSQQGKTGTVADSSRVYLSATVPHIDRAWASLSAAQRDMVDLMAADFFETALSSSQRHRIGTLTAHHYITAEKIGQHNILRARRNYYHTLSRNQRKKLINSKAPPYLHLSESQKAPFRRHAMEMMELKFDAATLANDAGGTI